MKGASAAVYLRESKNIVLHAKRVLSSNCHSQKSRQGPKAPHVEVRRVEELVFVDDDAQRGEGPLNKQVGARWSLRAEADMPTHTPILQTINSSEASNKERQTYHHALHACSYPNTRLQASK